MKTEYATVEVWLVIDEGGDYDVGGSEEQAQERFAETIGGEVGAVGLRRVKLAVKIPLPKVIELAGEVECDEAAAVLVAR